MISGFSRAAIPVFMQSYSSEVGCSWYSSMITHEGESPSPGLAMTAFRIDPSSCLTRLWTLTLIPNALRMAGDRSTMARRLESETLRLLFRSGTEINFCRVLIVGTKLVIAYAGSEERFAVLAGYLDIGVVKAVPGVVGLLDPSGDRHDDEALPWLKSKRLALGRPLAFDMRKSLQELAPARRRVRIKLELEIWIQLAIKIVQMTLTGLDHLPAGRNLYAYDVVRIPIRDRNVISPIA